MGEFIITNAVISMKTLNIKSLLTSLCQREEMRPFERICPSEMMSPLLQRGERGDFSMMMTLLMLFLIINITYPFFARGAFSSRYRKNVLQSIFLRQGFMERIALNE